MGELFYGHSVDQVAGESQRVVFAKRLVQARAAEIGVDNHHAFTHLRVRDAQTDGGGRLPLAGDG